MVAVGPFTTSEDLEFAPLEELLGSCRGSPPDILLLIGPFVDVEHALIASGSLDITFEELFETQVKGYSLQIGEGLHVFLTLQNLMISCPQSSWGNTDIAPGLVCELAGAQLHFVREPAVHVSRVPH